jgi:hypothetical protein
MEVSHMRKEREQETKEEKPNENEYPAIADIKKAAAKLTNNR